MPTFHSSVMLLISKFHMNKVLDMREFCMGFFFCCGSAVRRPFELKCVDLC